MRELGGNPFRAALSAAMPLPLLGCDLTSPAGTSDGPAPDLSRIAGKWLPPTELGTYGIGQIEISESGRIEIGQRVGAIAFTSYEEARNCWWFMSSYQDRAPMSGAPMTTTIHLRYCDTPDQWNESGEVRWLTITFSHGFAFVERAEESDSFWYSDDEESDGAP